MNAISYRTASVPVREAFTASHNRFWKRLAALGSWWTGAERVAMAAEVRNAWTCSLCKACQEALTPAAIQGQHDHLGALPEAATVARPTKPLFRVTGIRVTTLLPIS